MLTLACILLTIIAALLAIQIVLLRAEPKASIESLASFQAAANAGVPAPLTQEADTPDAVAQLQARLQAVPGVQVVNDVRLIESQTGPILQIQATVGPSENGAAVAEVLRQMAAAMTSFRDLDLYVALDQGRLHETYFWSNAARRWTSMGSA